MRSLARVVAAAAVGMLVLTACGGDDNDTDADAEPAAADDSADAEQTDGDEPAEPSGLTGCDLLSAEELAAVVGNPIIEAVPFGGVGCSYEGTDIADVYATFGVMDASGGDATLVCDSALLALNDYGPVSGLGDTAYLETRTAELEFEPGKRLANASVIACTERVVVSLALNGHRAEEELGQMAIDLTRTILDRI